ncbi:MAG TPA: carbamoyl phosphate synthase large subunit [Bdellovibrionales bacterium]|nr:carbamoyl phosphate synthase large subunit [Bdellovibrionales bacterium]
MPTTAIPTIDDVNFLRSLKKTRIFLHFSDGTTFKGFVNKESNDPLIKHGLWGEAAFTTGMSGYEETATDPSFLGQHIIYTTAHVGNYPSEPKVRQSKKCHATALIARNFSYNEFLATQDIPLVSGIDTRALTLYMTKTRDHHSVLSTTSTPPPKEAFSKAVFTYSDLYRVSQERPQILRPGEHPIVVVNYGVKEAILGELYKLNLPLVTVPYNTTSQAILAYHPSLIFLTNGPGDPRSYKEQIKVVAELLKTSTPIRGICLGHQLITLALGAKIIKLPFGQRGANHPVFDHVSGKILITSQNHGYAADYDSLKGLASSASNLAPVITHTSLFDHSVEGLALPSGRVKSVQFHPEANPGPRDALGFFHEIHDFLGGHSASLQKETLHPLPHFYKNGDRPIPYKKILLIGSGPIKIGQASEFDYSGTQALKALRELGLEVVLLNSNPATIMTDPEMCAKTYVEPITKETVKFIIQNEKVDAIISTMGGQTALNLCVELEEENFLREHHVALLGAGVSTIKRTEDRTLFAQEMDKLGYKAGKRFLAHSEEEAIRLAQTTAGFPLIIRRDFALGGRGSALTFNLQELKEVFTTDIKFPITLEKSLVGYKEIEMEVMVDCEQNGVIICSIENVDPCGVHTGDSITVAPALTISDHCLQTMRDMTLRIARHMGVVAGGANVQFAVHPNNEEDITVIEMNPRVSRSSALASKATGYPIAKISAQLAVGLTLKEILNDITRVSPVAFEPTLDYVAVKIPIFPFSKFPTSSTILGPQMRSVGEVLALGGSFNEAFLKALRSLEMGLEIPSLAQLSTTPLDITPDYIRERLQHPHQLSLLTVLEALRLKISKEEIADLSKISPWFINQMAVIFDREEEFKQVENPLQSADIFQPFKEIGFSDKYLAFLKDLPQKKILEYRMKEKIFPVFKAVDTCAGEFAAETPYFYSTYAVQNEAVPLSHDGRSVLVMGSGPNRIGQGIEFDYSCVKACERLKNHHIQSIMANSNPETVSTDYDSSDRLYITPLFTEDLCEIFRHENPEGIIASFSGQTGIKIREHFERGFRKDLMTFNFLGPSYDAVDITENRERFNTLTASVDLARTKSMLVKGHKNLLNAMTEIGLPVIIRPSYVIGGESMYIFNHHEDINHLPPQVKEQLKLSTSEFLVETYLRNAIEYDVDLVRDKAGHVIFTVCEHIEHAGVHSGDSGMFAPPLVLTQRPYKKLMEITKKLASDLEIVGPINFQFAIIENDIYCIEANPRGSRTLPFLSKAYNLNIPAMATDAMLGLDIPPFERETFPYFSVKQSTFPFDRFIQDNIILGPKMRSTGETMGIDCDKDHAVFKSYLGNYPKLFGPGKILISLADPQKPVILPYLRSLIKKGYQFMATQGSYDYIKKQGIPCTLVAKIGTGQNNNGSPTILEAMKDDQLKMVLNTPANLGQSKSDGEMIRNTAILYGVPCFTRAENIRAIVESILTTDHYPVPRALQDLYREL